MRGGEKCELRCNAVAAGPFTAAASQQRPGGETLGLELMRPGVNISEAVVNLKMFVMLSFLSGDANHHCIDH